MLEMVSKQEIVPPDEMTEIAVDAKTVRKESVVSNLSTGANICRICHSDDSSCGVLVSPCLCSGSVRWIHEECLNHWISVSNNNSCEVCGYPFALKTNTFWEWLPLRAWERKKLIRSLVFTLIALGWVVGSLYVIIKNNVVGTNQLELKWRSWTNITIETIGCISAVVLLIGWVNFQVKLVIRSIHRNRRIVIDTSVSPPQKKTTCEDQPSSLIARTRKNVDFLHVGRIEGNMSESRTVVSDDAGSIIGIPIAVDDFVSITVD